MDSLWKVFIAPGNKDNPLPIEPSSWHFDRIVRMLDGHWDTILKFANTIDEHQTTLLEASAEEDFDKNLTTKDLNALVFFIDDIIKALEAKKTEIITQSENNPDDFEGSVYIDIVRAVQAIFREALRLNESYQVYNDS